MPQDTDDTMPYSWIVFHVDLGWGYSGEMGFERNLDQYEYIGREPIVTVVANWGWPEIPQDVKLATVWTLQSVLSDKEGPVAESIEGYSRSYGSTGAGLPLLGVPNRARDILAPYQKLYA